MLNPYNLGFINFSQVFNLQTQLAHLKELQSAQSFTNDSGTVNPNGKFSGKFFPQYNRSQDNDVQSSFGLENSSNTFPQLISTSNQLNCVNGVTNPNLVGDNYADYSLIPDENVSYGSFEEANSFSMSSLGVQPNNKQWDNFQEYSSELQSMAFGYVQNWSSWNLDSWSVQRSSL